MAITLNLQTHYVRCHANYERLSIMTVGRFQRLLHAQPGLRVEEFTVKPLYWAGTLASAPVVGEYFASSVRAVCIRE